MCRKSKFRYEGAKIHYGGLIYLISFVLVLGLAGASAAEEIDPNLVGWWKLDDGFGTIATDWSGHDNHGSLVGDPQWVSGYIGGTLDFDGDGDYVDCGYDPIFDITDEITVAAWVNIRSIPVQWAAIVAKGEYAWRLSNDDSDPRFHFGITIWSDANPSVNGNTAVGYDEWHHVAGMYDGSNINLYLDGVLDVNLSNDTGIGTNTENLLIGENPEAAERYWDGFIDDVRVYNVALMEDEIAAVMSYMGDDPSLAWGANPINGQTDVLQDVVLRWKAGIYAETHNVYLGTSFDDVNEASIDDTRGVLLGQNLAEPIFDPPVYLDFSQTYYWRIDEVNDTEPNSPWKGNIWSFTVANFTTVDDFEDYNDTTNKIYNTWVDYAVNNTGMTVGHFNPPFVEQTIVHSGSQAMYMRYDNDGTVNEGTAYEQSGTLFYSEVERQWETPQDWTANDIESLTLWFRGIPASVGSFIEGPPITMTANGKDIYDTADEFHFAYKRFSGAGSITAKVLSVSNTHLWAKAGVMIRQSLEPGSLHAAMVVTPGSGVSFQRRTAVNGGSEETQQEDITAPHWVRLIRAGNTLIGQHSDNGATWTTLGSVNIPMLLEVYAGLCLTSHNVDETCTAEFSDVTISGMVTGDWLSQDIGIKSNIAEPMYVALADNAGNSALVNHPDPAASLIGSWTEWNIPFADFPGVNMQAIKRLAIGIGDQANTLQPGGAGTMFIDDIRLYLPTPEPEQEPDEGGDG
jgi:regulation of enolase protein 1 (concanavalin A-like superfamily)